MKKLVKKRVKALQKDKKKVDNWNIFDRKPKGKGAKKFIREVKKIITKIIAKSAKKRTSNPWEVRKMFFGTLVSFLGKILRNYSTNVRRTIIQLQN